MGACGECAVIACVRVCSGMRICKLFAFPVFARFSVIFMVFGADLTTVGKRNFERAVRAHVTSVTALIFAHVSE